MTDFPRKPLSGTARLAHIERKAEESALAMADHLAIVQKRHDNMVALREARLARETAAAAVVEATPIKLAKARKRVN